MMPKEQIEAIKTQYFQAKEIFAAMPTSGQRFKIPREGKESVSAIIYEPVTRAEDMPALVYLHGGAWIAGDAVQMDEYCRKMADALPGLVVNINYRKLMEQPFPYQQYEAADTVRWLMANAKQWHIDPRKIILSGGSAGGHIAAGAALLLAREGIAVAGQLLEFPFLDFTYTEMKENGQFPELTAQLHGEFFPDLDLEDPEVSPALAKKECLHRLPPADFLLATMDPICTPQSVRYAKRLRQAGVAAEYHIYEGTHGLNKVEVGPDGTVKEVDDYCNPIYMEERKRFIWKCTGKS